MPKVIGVLYARSIIAPLRVCKRAELQNKEDISINAQNAKRHAFLTIVVIIGIALSVEHEINRYGHLNKRLDYSNVTTS